MSTDHACSGERIETRDDDKSRPDSSGTPQEPPPVGPPSVGPPSGELLTMSLRSHPHCVVCGQNSVLGLGLRFSLREDGSVESRFHCRPAFEGYPNQLHGGVIALLLDGAMTNCLFAHGQTGVTARLEVHYRRPVSTNGDAILRAWIARSHPRLHTLSAEFIQDGEVKASGTAKFMDSSRRPSSAP